MNNKLESLFIDYEKEHKKTYERLLGYFLTYYPGLSQMNEEEMSHYLDASSHFYADLLKEIRKDFKQSFPDHWEKFIITLRDTSLAVGFTISNESIADHLDNYCMDLFIVFDRAGLLIDDFKGTTEYYAIAPELKSFFIEHNIKEAQIKNFFKKHLDNIHTVLQVMKK